MPHDLLIRQLPVKPTCVTQDLGHANLCLSWTIAGHHARLEHSVCTRSSGFKGKPLAAGATPSEPPFESHLNRSDSPGLWSTEWPFATCSQSAWHSVHAGGTSCAGPCPQGQRDSGLWWCFGDKERLVLGCAVSRGSHLLLTAVAPAGLQRRRRRG